MSRSYAVLDVFADRPLAGNPLAVVLDGSGLSSDQMQAIAGEFNLSETVFVLPPQNPVHRAALRIFTPDTELPFAGHPTVGAAVLLGLDAVGEDYKERDVMLMLEEEIGAVRCGVYLRSESVGHATFDLPRHPQARTELMDSDLIAAALDLAPHEVGFENHVISSFDAGLPFAFVPVLDLDTIGQVQPRTQFFAEAFGSDQQACVYVYTRETVSSEHHFHARMFAPGLGVMEDPATGSAAAAFAGVVARFDQPPAGSHRYVIEQGYKMGRPSLIGLELDIDGGAVHAARISGDAVVVARGTLSV
ncbi:MAG: PhzF family phenazine biosynthesis protein [Hyphomicrobiales bacterium]|nr:PhzF family phenazine biosynthesis protein [Hyphomicrobiales bacterium]